MRLIEAAEFSKKVGDDRFVQVGVALDSLEARRDGVSFDEARKNHPVCGSLGRDLKSLAGFLGKAVLSGW